MSAQQEPADDDTSTALSAIAPKDLFTEFLDRIEAVVPEAILYPADDGIAVRAVGPADIGMIDSTLAASECESYDANDDFRVGVDINRLRDSISVAGDDDAVIELSYRDDAKFHVDGPDFHGTVGGLDPDTVRQPPDIPDLDLPATFTIAGDKLKRAVDGVDTITEVITVRWNADADAVEMFGAGDIDGMDFDFDADDDLEAVDNRPDESISSMLATDYLGDIVDVIDTNRDVRVELGDEMPMWMHQDFADDSPCLFMIAPRLPGVNG